LGGVVLEQGTHGIMGSHLEQIHHGAPYPFLVKMTAVPMLGEIALGKLQTL
jgi:hypothetical protein